MSSAQVGSLFKRFFTGIAELVRARFGGGKRTGKVQIGSLGRDARVDLHIEGPIFVIVVAPDNASHDITS